MKTIFRKLLVLVLIVVALMPTVFITPQIKAALSTTPTDGFISVDWVVNNIEVASDGSVYVGGYFERIGIYTGYGVPVSATTSLQEATFPEVNGAVWEAIDDGNGGWYISGEFSRVGTYTRNGVAHINPDGSVDTNFNPDLGSGGTARALLLDGTTLYVGGNFSKTVDATTWTDLAAFDTSDGSIQDWNPSPGGTEIREMVLSGTTLYIGGSFSTAGGQSRANIAAISTTTGNATDWNPGTSGMVYGLALNGTTLYVSGQFTTAGGSSRTNLAALNTAVNTNNATAWNPTVNGRVDVVRYDADSGILFIGGVFSSAGIVGVGSSTRNNVAAYDIGSGGSLSSWNPDIEYDPSTFANYDYVLDLAIYGDSVYVAGYFGNVGNSTLRYSVVELDKATGTPTSWDPGVSSSVDVVAVSNDGASVYIGGYTTALQSITRKGVAKVNPDGSISSWNAQLDGTLETMLLDGDTLYIGGDFTQAGGEARTNLAAFDVSTGNVTAFDPDPDSSVLSMAKTGDTLYVGGYFTSVNNNTTPVARNYGAAFDVTTSVATEWNPNFNNAPRMMRIHDSTIYMGGEFTSINGGTTRNHIASANLTDGTATSWNPDADNWVTDIAFINDTAYLVGYFTTMNGGTTRNGGAAVDLTNGTINSWNPNGDDAIIAIESHNDHTLILYGEFNTLNGGTSRNHLAEVNLTDGTVNSWSPYVGDSPSQRIAPYETEIYQDRLYTAGEFVSFATYYEGVNSRPDVPSSLGPSGVVDGSSSTETQPTFNFTLADSDGGDTVQYQIQIDDSADFSSPVIDYTSVLATPGSASFTVGQATGSGSYTVGSSGQELSAASYYWRVRTLDNSGVASNYATANSGSVAFIVTEADSDPTPSPTPTPTPTPTPAPATNTAAPGDNGAYSPALPPSCDRQTLLDKPDLFQAVTRITEVELYVTPAKDASEYVVSYGYDASNHTFGTTLGRVSEDGVQKLVIRDLAPNTTYYFMVRGQAGCQTGHWSNVLKIKTTSKGAQVQTFHAYGQTTESSTASQSNATARVLGASDTSTEDEPLEEISEEVEAPVEVPPTPQPTVTPRPQPVSPPQPAPKLSWWQRIKNWFKW